MEYLNSIEDPLKEIDEKDYHYINLYENPQYIYGNINYGTDNVDFCKYPVNIQEETRRFGDDVYKSMTKFRSTSCGCRLRFNTTSPHVIFKIELERKYSFRKMSLTNSHGFDVYGVDDGQYNHIKVFAPNDGKNIFAEKITVPPNGNICVFLPNYNTIKNMYLGIEENSDIKEFNYPKKNRIPILFYGNSTTQGAAASRSGNSFANIISRKFDNDLINLSTSFCCRGMESCAELMGKINCKFIVIDYNRNAYNATFLRNTHEKFYRTLRDYHPDKKIVLMTARCFNYWKDYDLYDEVIKTTYVNARKRGENTFLLRQKALFDEEDYDLVSVDASHYTDFGMYRIADEIENIINGKDYVTFENTQSFMDSYYEKIEISEDNSEKITLDISEYLWSNLLNPSVTEDTPFYRFKRKPGTTLDEKGNFVHYLGRYYYNIYEKLPLDSSLRNVSLSFYFKTSTDYLWAGLSRYKDENNPEAGLTGSAFYSKGCMEDGVTPAGNHIVTWHCDDNGIWNVYFDGEETLNKPFKFDEGYSYYPVLYNPQRGIRVTCLDKIIVDKNFSVDELKKQADIFQQDNS